jgi:hypothetical protein
MSEEAKEVITVALIVKDVALVFLGALIGLGASEITAWRRRREDKKAKAIDTISDVVRFFLKINEMANDIKSRMTFFREREHDPQVAKEHREYMIKTRGKLPELSVEELFREFQLELVGNKNISKKFRALIDAYRNYVDSFDKSIETFKEKEAVYSELYKDFMNLCVEVSKINAPKRTLSALAKKKGLSRKS